MRKLFIILTIISQIALLTVMAGQREIVLHNGKTVHIQTTPVDPRDYFRGDFVRLSYEISMVHEDKFRDGLTELKDDNKVNGKMVYAVLNINDGGLAEMEYLTDKNLMKINYSFADESNNRVGLGLMTLKLCR